MFLIELRFTIIDLKNNMLINHAFMAVFDILQKNKYYYITPLVGQNSKP